MDRNNPLIGVNLPLGITTVEALQKELDHFLESGFQAVEIRLDSFPLIIGGEIVRPWVDKLADLLSAYPLSYAFHIGRGLDLREQKTKALHRKVLYASMEIAQILGSDVLVLHYEETSPEAAIEEEFRQALREAAVRADQLGLTLCLENIEVERVQPVIDCIKSVDHPRLRMNFDTGHAFLAARHFGFNFLDAFKASLPLLGHMHLNDNTGVFEPLRVTDRPVYDGLSMGYRLEFGRGDIHLPPYWGKIPFDEIFSLLDESPKLMICEYYSERFKPFNSEIAAKMKEKTGKKR